MEKTKEQYIQQQEQELANQETGLSLELLEFTVNKLRQGLQNIKSEMYRTDMVDERTEKYIDNLLEETKCK